MYSVIDSFTVVFLSFPIPGIWNARRDLNSDRMGRSHTLYPVELQALDLFRLGNLHLVVVGAILCCLGNLASDVKDGTLVTVRTLGMWALHYAVLSGAAGRCCPDYLPLTKRALC
jgi:hypothetical protein